MNLFDVTADETISSIRTNLLKSGDNLTEELQNNLKHLCLFLLLDGSVAEIWTRLDKSQRGKPSNNIIL